MSLEEAIAALSRGCCTRAQAKESGCQKCVAKYAAMDWLVAALEATQAITGSGEIVRGDYVFSRGYRRGRAEADALRHQIEIGGCAAAHLGETTYECDIAKPCGLCRTRADLTRLREIERLARARLAVDFGPCTRRLGENVYDCKQCERCKLRAALNPTQE